MKAKLLIVLLVLVIGVSAASAQERVVSGKDLLARMERSLKQTGEGAFRIHVSIEVGDTKEGPWLPSRTSIVEVVLPDRERRRYANYQYTEIINIGYQLFKKFPDGRWMEDERTLIPFIGRHPARFIRAPDDLLHRYTESHIGDTVIITMERKAGADADPSVARSQAFTYYFDSSGVLFKIGSVSYSFRHWSLATQTIEYDPTIRIEAPILYIGLPSSEF